MKEFVHGHPEGPLTLLKPGLGNSHHARLVAGNRRGKPSGKADWYDPEGMRIVLVLGPEAAHVRQVFWARRSNPGDPGPGKGQIGMGPVGAVRRRPILRGEH